MLDDTGRAVTVRRHEVELDLVRASGIEVERFFFESRIFVGERFFSVRRGHQTKCYVVVRAPYVTPVAVPVRVKDDTEGSKDDPVVLEIGSNRFRYTLVNVVECRAGPRINDLNEARAKRSPRRAPVVQLDRTSAYEAESREFESLRARQLLQRHHHVAAISLLPLLLQND